MVRYTDSVNKAYRQLKNVENMLLKGVICIVLEKYFRRIRICEWLL